MENGRSPTPVDLGFAAFPTPPRSPRPGDKTLSVREPPILPRPPTPEEEQGVSAVAAPAAYQGK